MADCSDGFGTRRQLVVGDRQFHYFSLRAADEAGLAPVRRLPRSLRVLLENLLRHSDEGVAIRDDIAAVAHWPETRTSDREISFYPARVIMPDSSGVPLIADLAAMRDAVRSAGGNPDEINPLIPVDLVIDHSAAVDFAGRPDALARNLELEYARERERYTFLKWAQNSFRNLRVVPPAMGIVHQVNLEYLARAVWTSHVGETCIAYPDTLVGMDSHTPMVNSLGVIGWGVGGIEAGAAMLGQPISMLLPEVVGCRIKGVARPGVTCTDLVLTLTQQLRKHGVVGKFVEFFGEGLARLPLADRATLANMTPEFGATVSYFPIDSEALRYLALTGRDAAQLALIEAYAKAQGLWGENGVEEPCFTSIVEFDLGSVEASVSGPKRPQDRVPLRAVPDTFKSAFAERLNTHAPAGSSESRPDRDFTHGDVVIAAITSCTNTSNPSAMVGAGLLARNLRKAGLSRKPWVKTSLAPGSRVVTDYLEAAGLLEDLSALGFDVVGYGCMTCSGASGPLAPDVTKAIDEQKLVVASVLSGNRNFEGRIHPSARANYLASPALVVAYAAAGSVLMDLTQQPMGIDARGLPVLLEDLWPSDDEIARVLAKVLSPSLFSERYATVFAGDSTWQKLEAATALNYPWDPRSTYIRRPPYFDEGLRLEGNAADIANARILALLGDSITTDHISPVSGVRPNTPAGKYLAQQGVAAADFNSFSSRRGNHDVMIRGTFSNIRLRNEMAPEHEGGITRHVPSEKEMPIYDAAMLYREERTPLIVVAGAEYGTGSSRDWAAKGTRLLGVRAVLAESFERIHRSNLIGMGVLPLQFPAGVNRKTLKLTGDETFTFRAQRHALRPRQTLACHIAYADGRAHTIEVTARLDIPREIEWYEHGGILPYMLAKVLGNQKEARRSEPTAPTQVTH